ncbi:MAG: GGDEF domain-containing protein [Sulfuricaulis sp.]|uniref:GGDEF domain-containing protein n=1 Tax=Sulfuricaulis sp. TaxID=2003553 RepID=UPI0025FA2910|nr:GGDEF domain-containing protein [Sulfuricaulis sp.]MCR4346433.1 GGDEF domain-containing protein [Sulfuricaulis sp.]
MYLKAVKGTKLNGERVSLSIAKKTATGHVVGHAPPAPVLKTFINEIDACMRLVKSAQHQVEILVERNAGLQQELVKLTHKEAQARHLAYHDGLTGLPNRSLLQDRLQQAMSHADRYHKPLALLMIDLDEFKRVNDKLGHASGDKLLQAVAARLSKSIRGADTACRYGGDEFVIMLPEIYSPNIVAAHAVEIGSRLGKPYIIDGHKIHMAVSIGVAVYPGDGQTFSALMNQADIAMYRNKRAGPSTCITELPKKDVGHPGFQNPSAPGNFYRLRERDLFIQDELMHAREQQKKHQQI